MADFYRATTPTHKFKLNISLDTVEELKICYSQKGYKVLKKTLADCKTENGNTVVVTLTQEETKKFYGSMADVQIKVKTGGGNVLASPIYKILCKDVLDDEVM